MIHIDNIIVLENMSQMGEFFMQHSFDVDIAQEYGVLEAVLLNNLWFWIQKNKANDTNFFDGDYWTYNSTKAFTELFPYATQRQIQNALKKLKDKGIIKTGNYNKSAYDRTLWYAFTQKGKCIMQKCKMEDAEKGNGIGENVKPIPDSNPDDKPNSKPDIINNSDLEIEFEELWSKYPNKKDKTKALKYYKDARKKGTTKEEVSLGIDNYNKEISIKKTEKKYIKHGSTWFYNKCWQDEYDFTPPSNNGYKRTEITPDWLNKPTETILPSDEELAELEAFTDELEPFEVRKQALQEKLRSKYGKSASETIIN